MEIKGFFTRAKFFIVASAKKKAIFVPTILVIMVALGGVGYYTYLNLTGALSIPTVVGANFSIDYQKIPYNTKSIDITFGSNLDAKSINPQSVTISPAVDGIPTLIHGNTISYQLKDSLKINTTYTLTIRSDVKSVYGKPLPSTLQFSLRTIAGAMVTRILPSGNVDNLGQDIVVLFNTPLVPLTNLNTGDTLPCPLEISPAVEGKCSWIDTNILKFIPSKPLLAATKYHLTVSNTTGLLYPLSEIFETNITTPALALHTSNENFDPNHGITLISNAPIETAELQKNIQLTVSGETTIHAAHIIPLVTESGAMSDTYFQVLPTEGTFFYSKHYTILAQSGTHSKFGNQPLARDEILSANALDYLLSIDVYRTIHDASGSISDTQPIEKGKPIPTKNVFFRLSFSSTTPLDKQLFRLTGESGATIDFDLHYVKMNDASGATVDNQYSIDLAPKISLNYDASYTLTLDKSTNPKISENITQTVHTTPKFSIADIVVLNNTETCVYANSDFSEDTLKTITTKPESTIRNFSKAELGTTEHTCPGEKRIAWLLSTRFLPNTAYMLNFSSATEDINGNQLEKEKSFPIKTGPILKKDKYLYTSLNKPIQVIPTNLPIVLNLLSINLDRAQIEICEMNTDGYKQFLSNRYNPNYSPLCETDTLTGVTLKNHFWTLTPNKIDIEKDILGRKLHSPFIFVRGALDHFNTGYNGYPDPQQEFSLLFIRSNLSLTLENGNNKTLLFASSYDGKTLPSDLRFEAYRQTSGSFESVSPKFTWNGKLQLYQITGSDFDLLLARNDTFFGVLTKNEDQTSNYDFKYISGQDSSTKDYLYLSTDRPLYKGGDTVFFKGLLRTFNFDGYHPSSTHSGTLKIVAEPTEYGEAGTIIKEFTFTPDENSNFNGKFLLPKDATFGRYHFEFFAGENQLPVYNNAEFYVEAYKKPVFKVTTIAPKSDVILGESTDLTSHAEYYFGGSMGLANYDYSIMKQSYYFNAQNYADYQFGNGSSYMDCLYWDSCDNNDALDSIGTGVLDKNGNGSFHFDYPIKDESLDNPSSEKIYTYHVTVTDPQTQKTVTATTSQILHATDGYVGLRVPYWNEQKSGMKINGVVLDYAAKPLVGKQVELVLIKREWKTIKKQGVDGVFYNESSVEETTESSEKVTSDQNGEYSQLLHPKSEGEYLVRAIYTGSNKQSFQSSSFAYVSGTENTSWNDGNNSLTDMAADKTMLSVGDTARFTIKSPVTIGKMFVTIEKDDGILDAFVMDISNSTPRLEIPILDTYLPNIYVKVFLIGQPNGEKLPIYKRALSVIKVVTDPKKLSVIVTPDKSRYLPGDVVKINIDVRDLSGKGVVANGSLSIVDESLLALAGNPLKNPYAFFYDMKRYLGVNTYLSLLNLIEKLEVKDVSTGEKGGAGDTEKGGLSTKKRGVFKDTAFWKADFVTDTNGKATITTDALPDNLTTWAIESIINASGNRVGIGFAKAITTKTVIVNENLPRFLGSSDTIVFAPVIFNKTGKTDIFNVELNATHLNCQEIKKTMTIPSDGQAAVPFNCLVNDSNTLTGSEADRSAHITIKATAKQSGDLDEVENTLPIIITSTSETVATAGKTNTTIDEAINLPSEIRANGGALTINYSTTLLPHIISGIKFLEQFPYGCIEQKLSSIMPTIYLKELYASAQIPLDLSKKTVDQYISANEGYIKKPIEDVIREILFSVPSFQKKDGGFGYWTEGTGSDFWLTLSTAQRLAEIASAGYDIDRSVLQQAISYIKQTFYTNKYPYCYEKNESDCTYPLADRLHAVESIIDATSGKDYEALKMFKLLTFAQANDVGTKINHLRVLVKLSQASALSDIEKIPLTKEATTLLASIVNDFVAVDPRGSFLGEDSHYSRLNNTVHFLEATSLLPQTVTLSYQPVLDQMKRWVIAQKKSDGSFGSTADTTEVIAAMSHILRTSGELANIRYEAKLSLDNTLIATQIFDQTNKLTSFSKEIPVVNLADNSTIHFEKAGSGSIFYDLAMQYFIPSKNTPARNEGFFVTQSYYDYNEYKNIEKEKETEWRRYMSGEIEYSALKYQKEIVSYLKPLTSLTIGKLVYVHTSIMTGDARDNVAFEGFIPGGTELINPQLATEDPSTRFNSLFDHEEFRDDRYFGTVTSLDSGVYHFGYILRPTHAGIYNLLPARAFEFYRPEVFGRNEGKTITIKAE